MAKQLFVFNVVGLSPAHLQILAGYPAFSRLMATGCSCRINPVLPAVTIPCQASLATGTYPDRHGMIANGLYYKDRKEVSFWDQYRSLVQSAPFWETLKNKRPELTTAVLFWQNTLFGNADIIITPKPIHSDHEMIQWCYSKPVGLYEELAATLSPFDLKHYWGPLASPASSHWIMQAAIKVVETRLPNLMMVYLPMLDYSCQRFGPDAPQVHEELKIVDELLGKFLAALDRRGLCNDSAIAVLSEYSMTEVRDAIPLNRLLREAGLLAVREIAGHEYLDYEMSPAFAMVDHQIAHIFCRPDCLAETEKLLRETAGISMVLDREGQQAHRLGHERSGDLVAVSAPDRWFSYYWWLEPAKAPGFSHTVDIHNKPGYDPLELFFDPKNRVIPQHAPLVKGSHGAPAKIGGGKAVLLLSNAGAATLPEEIEMVDVAQLLEEIILAAQP